MTRALTFSLALFGFIVGALSGCHKSDAPQAEQERPPVPVRTAKAEKRVLEPVFEVIGVVLVEPGRAATLTAATPGLVDQLAVTEGVAVKKGQLIVRLDDRKAKTDLDRAEAAYARLIAKPRPDELVVARGAIEKAKAALSVARSQLTRAKATRASNPTLVTDIQLLDYERLERIAAADVDDSEAAHRLLELGPKEEMRKEAHVEVDATKLQLQYCQLIAPFDGVVVELLARVGMKADVGTPVARIIDTSEVLVQARVPGNRLGELAKAIQSGGKGPLATIRSAAFPGEPFTATSGWLNQQTELLTSDVPVTLRVANPKALLRVGMTVRAELREPPVECVAIPEVAVSVNEEGHRVVTVVKDGKAVPTEIEIASDVELEVRAGGWVRVLNGLQAGDEVTIENGYALPKDTPVQVLAPRQPNPDRAP